MSERLRIREILTKAELELNPSRSWPLDLLEIIRFLGLQLDVKNSPDQRGTAHLVVSERPQIVINKSRNDNPLENTFDRFSIAHEIGHWVIWRRLGVIPRHQAEYWAHERLCNEFAANLLVPAVALSDHLQKLRERRVHPLHFPRSVAAVAKVSWHVAARSITALPDCEYWYLRFGSEANSRLVVNCSTVDHDGAYVGERAKIEDPDLSGWLLGLQVGRIASTSVSFVAGTFRIRVGRALFLRERSQSSTMRATMLMPRNSTELIRLSGRKRDLRANDTSSVVTNVS